MGNYQEAEKYLFKQLPMYQDIGLKAFKPGLDGISSLLEVLGNPQNSLRCVHIAGTNGKGTVCHILSSILQQHNLRIGVYTSPHYVTFRERMKINNKLIAESDLTRYIDQLRPEIDKHKYSFFEISVAIAFQYFKDQEVDVAIIETGMGGRLDSTNVIQPLISVITNIGLDHMDQLGDTLEKIAFEKAGIIKEFTPVVVGEKQKSVLQVFKDQAKKMKAPLVYADQLVDLSSNLSDQLQFTIQGMPYFAEFELQGEFQLKNLATSLAAYRVLCLELDLNLIGEDQMKYALEHIRSLTYYMGRFERVETNPDIILDSAHNEEGFELLESELIKMEYDELHIVLGMSKGKNVEGCLKHLPTHSRLYLSSAQIPRALPSNELAHFASKLNLRNTIFSKLDQAFSAALDKAKKNDLILVTGSVFTVAEILESNYLHRSYEEILSV